MSGTSTLPSEALVERADFEDSGRGLGCIRDVEAGEELLEIPLAHCWHGAASLHVPELAALVTSAGGALRDFDATALHLLIERSKGSESVRWAHLQELPAGYDSTLFWSDTELEELKGSAWLGLARRFADEARGDWFELTKLVAMTIGGLPEDSQSAPNLIDLYGITYQDYLWAYATLKSRAAEANVDGVAGTRLMAPGFDLFNHSDAIAPGTSHRFDNERQALIVVATRAYAKGEQAFISYGHASNGSLLLAGGFVLPNNHFDTVEVTLTSLVDAARLQTFMMAAPDAPDREQPTFEFLQVPDDAKIAAGKGGCAPFTTRHLLTAADPLPAALLSYVRLDRLDDADMAVHSRRAEKEGKQLWELVRSDNLTPLDALTEILALGALRDVLKAMLNAYPTSLKEDEEKLAHASPLELAPGRSSGDVAGAGESDASVGRARIALLLRSSEKRILHASLATLSTRLLPQFASLLNDAAAQERHCRKNKQSWGNLQARRGSVLSSVQSSMRIQRAFERLRTCMGARGSDGLALLIQSGTAFFLMISELTDHPVAHATMYEHTAGPFQSPMPTETSSQSDPPLTLPPLSSSILHGGGAGGSGSSELPYLELYVEKMCFWGAYLLSQWGVGRALSTDQMDTMAHEAASLREQQSRAVPTHEALAVIGRHAPIVELGAGRGLWASLLSTRGCDIVAYDEEGGEGGDKAGGEAVVRVGGPGVASSHSDRALLLIWPDLEGEGTFALDSLAAYSGQTLLLVGEWRGRALSIPYGTAFAPPFQAAVEADFEVVQQVRLPSWPTFVDVLTVWRRKSAPEAVQ